MFLAGYLKVHSVSYQASRVNSAVVCFHTSMHSSHSSPPAWMKISWLLERGHWTFPQYSQLEKRKGRGEGGRRNSFLVKECLGFILKLPVTELTKRRIGIYAYISLSEVELCKNNNDFPFPCFKMTSCSMQDREVFVRHCTISVISLWESCSPSHVEFFFASSLFKFLMQIWQQSMRTAFIMI